MMLENKDVIIMAENQRRIIWQLRRQVSGEFAQRESITSRHMHCTFHQVKIIHMAKLLPEKRIVQNAPLPETPYLMTNCSVLRNLVFQSWKDHLQQKP